MDLLSGSESDSQEKSNNELKINKKYAKSYEIWRKKEEKQKLIDKYGDDFNSSSDSEEEEIRPSGKLDKEWLRAYAVVRFNQPRLYSGEKLFNEEVTPVNASNEKKVTLKDYERKFILEKGGVYEDDDNNEGESQSKSYFEEQEEIKNSLKQAIGKFDDAEEKDEDTLLVKKEKTKEEQKEEENDYLAWLKGEREDLEDEQAAEELAPLKAYWSDPNLTDKEKVLRDYILNNGYMDKEGSDDDSDDDSAFDFNEEEEFLSKAENYEQTYNFRHEEPGGTEIKTYPRNIETSVRAKEVNRRAEKRMRKTERKLKEKEQRQEEIKMLQRLQHEEKQQKLQKLKEIAENPDLEYDLDADFDLEEHNRIMKKYFDENYYQDEASLKKPVFEPDEDEAFENEDDWWQSRSEAQMKMEEELANEEEQEYEELYADDPGFVMDVDYNPENVVKEKKSKKEAKKMKKKKKLEKLPLFDPTTKTFDEYLDEYLKDKINTLPFTYREVVPNDFGLSTDEILTAQDRELNSWVSVKKMSMYRNDHDEMYDFNKYRAKSKNQYKKLKVLPSLAQSQESSGSKKKKKKKKQHGEKGDDTKDNSQQEEKNVRKKSLDKSDKVKTIGKAKKRKFVSDSEQCGENDSLTSPKSKKKKKGKEDQTEYNNKEKTSQMETGDTTVIKVKKKSEKDENQDKDLVANNSYSEGSNSQESPKSKKNKKKKKEADGKNESVHEGNSGIVTKDTSKKKVKNHSKVDTNEVSDNNNDQDLEIADNKETQKVKESAPSLKYGEHVNVEQNHEVTKKKKKSHKKKKSKLKLDDSDAAEHNPATIDKQKAKQNLRKVMSATRLGSYGIGPGVVKHAGVKMGKKKKRKAINTDNNNQHSQY